MKKKARPILASKSDVKKEKIHLTSFEISELLVEIVLTIAVLIMLNVVILMILAIILNNNTELTNIFYTLKTWFSPRIANSFFHSWQKILILGMITSDTIILSWRVRRKFNSLQLRHVLDELQYISDGHFEHQIPFKLHGDLNRIASSINLLVESTNTAIEHERQIEKTKDELVSNISHDIRTPLTSIIGYLSLIEENPNIEPDTLHRYTHTAYRKSLEIKQMLDDLFEYTKMQEPTLTLNFMKFDVVAFLEQLSFEFSLEARKKGITVESSSTFDSLELVADSEKLVRVFSNLFTNALKYGHGATKIELFAEKIARDHQDFVKFTFRNNGEKIPEENLEKLFERFYRGDPSRNNDIKGHGIGLSIVETIIQLHQGEISVESDEAWTSFMILLPLTPKKDWL